MEMIKFAIYDSKVGSSLVPFYEQTVATGLRRWHFNCNNEGSDYNRYPGDYTLFQLATYEADTMQEEELEVKINHGLAQEQIGKDI